MKLFRYLTLITILIYSYGCATIVSGTSKKVTFKSQPPGVDIIVNGVKKGSTPAVIQIEKKSGQKVVFRKAGYRDYSFLVQTELNPLFFGNIVLGGVIGSTTDGMTGAMYEIDRNEYYVSLMPIKPLVQKKPLSAQIKDLILTAPFEMRSELAAGYGERLNSLLELMKVPAKYKYEITKRLFELSRRYKNDLSFAEAAVRELDSYKQ